MQFDLLGFGPPTYEVTATVDGTGGSISPALATVAEGETQAFTVTPDAGYRISAVSGCGGSLTGSTFTTGPISGACAVTVEFAVVVTARHNGGISSLDFLTLGGLLVTWVTRRSRRCYRPIVPA